MISPVVKDKGSDPGASVWFDGLGNLLENAPFRGSDPFIVPTRVELVTFAFGERRSKSIELRGICSIEYSII